MVTQAAKQALETPPAAASSTSDRRVIPLARVTVPFPVRYTSEAEFNGHKRVLEIRRLLVDLEYNIRQAGALIDRAEAEAGSLKTRLIGPEQLTRWERQDIEGRLNGALAKVEYQRELITQYQMEQQLFSAALGSETEG